ncbi:MAG: peptide-methionine (S)-S-oxide reductase MsrA [Vicinamibacteria bacterium]|nr:peptide-methionine (S)-S-oxide reductase MsrA [Vicinamibacteria bacterium]
MRWFSWVVGVALVAAVATLAAGQQQPARATATFAGGCFWCMEGPFEKLPGVLSVTSGYAGGRVAQPTYDQVSSGGTGHAEVVQVIYDPAKVSYDKLLHVFWRNIDPLTANAQFCDRGSQYRSAVFFHDEAQRNAATASKAALATRFPQQVVTEIVKLDKFWPAEEYHQDFYKKNPVRYLSYRAGCARDARLQELWGAEAGGGQ